MCNIFNWISPSLFHARSRNLWTRLALRYAARFRASSSSSTPSAASSCGKKTPLQTLHLSLSSPLSFSLPFHSPPVPRTSLALTSLTELVIIFSYLVDCRAVKFLLDRRFLSLSLSLSFSLCARVAPMSVCARESVVSDVHTPRHTRVPYTAFVFHPL